MTRLSEPMRRALAVLARTDLEIRLGAWVYHVGSAYRERSMLHATLKSLGKRGLAVSEVKPGGGYDRIWRITDAGRAEHER